MMKFEQDGLSIPAGEFAVFSIYRDPGGTSEVSGQEGTLCGALARHEATNGAEIVCRGTAYAKARYDDGRSVSPEGHYWALTDRGRIQLALEHGRLLERWRR